MYIIYMYVCVCVCVCVCVSTLDSETLMADSHIQIDSIYFNRVINLGNPQCCWDH